MSGFDRIPPSVNATFETRRRRGLRWALRAGIGVLIVLVILSLRPSAPLRAYRPQGEPLPMPSRQLALADRAGFDGILIGQRGTPVVVNVWASWCAPCRAEMPLLERAATRYQGRVTFLGVASKDDLGAARSFLDDVGVTYPNIFDVSGDIRRGLQLRGFPTTYVFDASGALRTAVVGGISEGRLSAQLQDLVD